MFTTQQFVQECDTVGQGKTPLMGDVKNMYTNLTHESILDTIRWVLKLAKEHFNINHLQIPCAKSKKPYWGTKPYQHALQLSLHELEDVLTFDLNNMGLSRLKFRHGDENFFLRKIKKTI